MEYLKQKNLFFHITNLFEEVYTISFFAKERIAKFNPKGEVQELSLKYFKKLPVYKQRSSKGIFKVSITLNDKVFAETSSPSIKIAEEYLAKKVLREYNWKSC